MEPIVNSNNVFAVMADNTAINAQTAFHSCRCCLRRPPDKRLTMPYIYLGKTEIYLDMLKECFDIRLAESGDGCPEICEVCVGRLRDASDFKLQVQRSQAELQALLDKALQTINEDLEIKTDIVDEDTPSAANEILHEDLQIKTDIVDEDTPSVANEMLHEEVDLKPEVEEEAESECWRAVKSEPDDASDEDDCISRTCTNTSMNPRILHSVSLSETSSMVPNAKKNKINNKEILCDDAMIRDSESEADVDMQAEDDSEECGRKNKQPGQPITKEQKKKRKWMRKNACIYCGKLVTNFTRHLMRHHKNESEVLQYMSIKDLDPKVQKQRKIQITDGLRNIGNFLHNSKVFSKKEGELITKKGRCLLSNPSNFTTCKKCLATFKRKSFHKHFKSCGSALLDMENLPGSYRKRVLANHSMSIIPNSSTTSPEVKNHISPLLRNDEISVLLETDPPVLAYGSRLMKNCDVQAEDDSEECGRKNKQPGQPITKEQKKKRKWMRKNACIYCGKLVTNFTRHLMRHHKNESEVLQYMSIKDLDPKVQKQRKIQITDGLRNIGNFLHNSKVFSKKEGELITKKGRCLLSNPSHFTTCKKCLATFKRKSFHKHFKSCGSALLDMENLPGSYRKRVLANHSMSIIPNSSTTSPEVKNHISPLLRNDEISV